MLHCMYYTVRKWVAKIGSLKKDLIVIVNYSKAL